MADSPAQRHYPKTESADAAQAFADYVALGKGRTLESLQKRYKADTRPVPTRRLSTLKVWSSAFKWQDRIKTAVTEEAERKLEEAAQLDAETFYETSVLLNDRVKYTTRHHLDEIVKMRESVRRPPVKGTVEVTGKNGGPIQHDHIHRDMSAFTDDEIEALAAIAERTKAGLAS